MLLSVNTFGYDAALLLVALVGTVTFLKRKGESHKELVSKCKLVLNVSLSIRAAALIGSAVAAAVHRRHLMMWAVFAPKLVFELAFFAVYAPVCAAIALCL